MAMVIAKVGSGNKQALAGFPLVNSTYEATGSARRRFR
jgi:hypothetical protein